MDKAKDLAESDAVGTSISCAMPMGRWSGYLACRSNGSFCGGPVRTGERRRRLAAVEPRAPRDADRRPARRV
ncbi:hypothetical protein LA080_007152 [Diaporthe eres]|nr:hypothetical protein LA080_007152 [Diaporthe eres]